jgi:hypothetical protein
VVNSAFFDYEAPVKTAVAASLSNSTLFNPYSHNNEQLHDGIESFINPTEVAFSEATQV